MTTDEAAGPAGPLPFDTSKAHQARMYDYLLGSNLGSFYGFPLP